MIENNIKSVVRYFLNIKKVTKQELYRRYTAAILKKFYWFVSTLQIDFIHETKHLLFHSNVLNVVKDLPGIMNVTNNITRLFFVLYLLLYLYSIIYNLNEIK